MSDQLRRFLSGAVSGTVTAAILQPLDVIKTTQQGQQLVRDAVLTGDRPAQGHRAGVLETSRRLVKTEGAASLWKGLTATVVRVFFGAGMYFVTLHAFADALGASSKEGGLQSFFAGAAARGLSAAVVSPVSVVKTRLEWATRGRSPYRGTAHALSSIARVEGFASLFSGLLPTIVRDAPFSGLYFAFYTRLKRAAREWEEGRGAAGGGPGSQRDQGHHGDMSTSSALQPGGRGGGASTPGVARGGGGALTTFGCGLIAGAAATLITHPADVVKTRLQIRDAKGRFVDGSVLWGEVLCVLRSEGPGAFMVGAGARVAKRAGQTAITWTLFEEAMKRSGGGGT